jgi:hypothetical protein
MFLRSEGAVFRARLRLLMHAFLIFHAMSKISKSFTPKISRYDANTITTWLEWKDVDLNNEKWRIPRDGSFLDAEGVVMPKSLEPSNWIRAKDLKNLTVFFL